jgi:hypothetical protein
MFFVPCFPFDYEFVGFLRFWCENKFESEERSEKGVKNRKIFKNGENR